MSSFTRSHLDNLPHELRHMLVKFSCLVMRAVLAVLPQFRVARDDVLRARRLLCEWAACEGYLYLLKWVHERDYPLLQVRDGRHVCAAAARGGDLAVLQWLREIRCSWDEHTCREAARGGHLEVLQWVHERGCPWGAEGVAVAAATGGHLHVLKWLRTHGLHGYSKVTLSAAQHGHVAVLEWALANGCPVHLVAGAAAICCSGNLHMVQWATKQNLCGWARFEDDAPGLTLDVLECVKAHRPSAVARLAALATTQLARVGDLEGLQWASENRFFRAAAVGRGAARGGQLAVLQWAYEKGLPDTEWDCAVLARRGHLACLQWAVANGKRPSAETCAEAAGAGHLCVLQWLREAVDCEWNGHTLARALAGGHWEVFQWARQQGCLVNAQVILTAATGGYADVLQWAFESAGGRIRTDAAWCEAVANSECLQMLRDHGCPWNAQTCVAYARRGDLELLQWAVRNGCPWDERTCHEALKGRNWALLEWAAANSCPMHPLDAAEMEEFTARERMLYHSLTRANEQQRGDCCC